MTSTLSRGRGARRNGLLGVALLMSANAWANPVPLNWVPANGAVVSGSTLSRIGGNAFSEWQPTCRDAQGAPCNALNLRDKGDARK